VDAHFGGSLARFLGFELVEQGTGTASVRATVGPDHANMHGTVHGGFVFALADEALSIASNSHGPMSVALVAAIHFIRPAREGDVLVAEAREISLGRTTATYEVSVSSEGHTIALFTGTVHRRGEAE
jgi:acyl-CoA thioesterase